jgi:hypothetical protein
MNSDEEIIKESINYLNKNKKDFLKAYSKNIEPSTDKMAIFTAGMSGVGKTELATFLTESNPNLLHIDTDEIREFFRPIGYNGQNSNLYQKVASRGFSELFSFSLKKSFSLIMDSNFANIEVAVLNIRRLLKKSYRIEILYLYDYPELCYEYATRREMVTHRKVPKDVFARSNINSYRTVVQIKELFREQVTLNFFDKRDGNIYNNIEIESLIDMIGEDFDI